MKISFYELLGMVEEGNIPEIRVERKARNLTNQYIKDKLNEIIDRLNGE